MRVKNIKGRRLRGRKKKDDKKLVPSLANLTVKEKADLENYVQLYANFLDNARTPRQTVDYVEEFALSRGFPKENIFINDDRSNIILVHYGTKPLEAGLRILGAHIDSPCLHVKPNPIKEGPLGVRIDTQYYGGILNYQWFDQQVDIIGYVYKKGKEIPVSIEGVIIDIAPHINRLTAQKVGTAFKAEDLDVLTGYFHKEDLLKSLGIEEKDFQRADLFVVPSQKTKIIKDLIVSYGHDDKVCMFAQLLALLDSDPQHVSIVFGVDREEIGSTSLTGAQSVFFEQVLDQIIINKGSSVLREAYVPHETRPIEDRTNFELLLLSQPYERRILSKSLMLSADVGIAATFRNQSLIDPKVHPKAGHGFILESYCGSGGKYNGNQVSAKVMDELMTLFDRSKAVYQVAGLPSKVDCGGGGTISKFFSQRGVPTIDAGVPVASMHGKNEVIHKGDFFQTYKGFKAFLEYCN